MGSSPSKVEEKKETSLECIGQKFTTFPSYISNYSHLRAATFSDNDLTSVKGILALKDLKQLTITHNNLTFLDEEIYFLRSLEKLDLSYNYLTTMDDRLGNLMNLRELNLSNNNINHICSTLHLITTLTSLDLSSNQLEELPSVIGDIVSLNHLNLSHNQLKRLVTTIGNLTNLMVLHLSDNELTQLPSTISNLVSLAKLYVDNNELLELPSEIGKCTSLKELTLNSNQLIDLPKSLALLPKLTVVDITDNLIENSQLTCASSTQALLQALKLKNDVPVQRKSFKPKKKRDTRRIPPYTNSTSPVATNNPDDRTTTTQEMKRVKERTVIAKWSTSIDESPSPSPSPPLREMTSASASDGTVAHVRMSTSAPSVTDKQKSFPHEFVQRRKLSAGQSKLESKPSPSPLKVSKRLFRFKLIHNLVLVDKMPLELSSLTDDAVYLLDCLHNIYVWVGSTSDPLEKMKAVHFAYKIKQEYINSKIIIIEGKKLYSRTVKEFWQTFGVENPKKIQPIRPSAMSDEEILESRIRESILYRFSEDETGRLHITVIADEPLTKAMLDSASCFVLDCPDDVYVWSGMYCSPTCKSWAMLKAEELIARGRTRHDRQILWNLDGAEMWEFTEHFFDWMDMTWGPYSTIPQEERPPVRDPLVVTSSTPPLNPSSHIPTQSVTPEIRVVAEISEDEHTSFVTSNLSSASTSVSTTTTIPTPITTTSSVSTTTTIPTPITTTSSVSTTTTTTTPPSVLQSETTEETKRNESKPQRNDEIPTAEETVTAPSSSSQTSSRVPIKQSASNSYAANSKKTQASPVVSTSHSNVSLQQRHVSSSSATPLDVTSLEPKPLPKVDIMTKLKPYLHAEELHIRILQSKIATLSKSSEESVVSSNAITSPREEIQSPLTEDSTENHTRPVSSVSTPSSVSVSSSSSPREEEISTTSPTSSTAPPKGLLVGPRRAAARSDRKAPTVNPIRARAEMSAQSMAAKPQTDEGESKTHTPAPAGGVSLLPISAEKILFKRKNLKSPTPMMSEKGQPRLIHIKGRKRLLVRQVELSRDSLNEGDVFILDDGAGTLFQWNGATSNRIEKGKALDIIKNIKDKEKGGNATVVVLDQGKNDQQPHADRFWELLGGRGPIRSAESGGDDLEVEKMMMDYVQLFKVVQVKNKIEPVLIAQGILKKEMLDDEECYLLDCIAEIFVWCGRKSTPTRRQHAMQMATELKQSREVWTAPISKEFSSSESVLFREKFANWGYGPPIQIQQVVSGKNIAKRQTTLSDMELVKEYASKLPTYFVKKEEVFVDDATGKVCVWRIEEFDKVEVPVERYGQFYSADSYLILYTYMWKNKESYLLYFWQGRNSPNLDRGTSAYLTVEMDAKLKKEFAGSAKEIRVVQNEEPKHFLKIFQNKLMIHKGREVAPKRETALFEVRGADADYVKAVEVSCTAKALHSAAVFLLRSPQCDYIWKGKQSADYELKYAQELSTHQKRKWIVLEEGHETSEFWNLLGAKVTLPKLGYPPSYDRRKIPRLFKCDCSGEFQVTEIWPFCQDHLERSDVYVLDAYSAIYVWRFDAQSHYDNPTELKLAMEFAVQYWQNMMKIDGRSKETNNNNNNNENNWPIYYIRGGKKNEPACFTRHFHAWDPTPENNENDGLISVSSFLSQFTRKYTYEELLNKQYPSGIDAANLETFLNEDEFENVFQMTREEFQKLPEWKKRELKRQKGLY